MNLKRSLRTAAKAVLIQLDTFSALARNLRPAIFEDEIGPALAQSVGGLVYGPTDMLTGLMARPRDPWFDDRRTPAAETRDEIVRKSFSQAVAELKGAFGESADTWTWGRVQTAAFAHAPFGLSGVAPLWSSGRYRPVLASREAVDREAEGRLVLTPAGDEK